MRVMFCPLASAGYTFPAIAVARALLHLRHEVAFVVAPSLGPLLETLDLRWFASDGAAVHRWHDPTAVAAQVEHLEAALGRFPADVLVGSALHLGSLLVAERAGLPIAVLGLLGGLPPAAADLRSELHGALQRARAHVALPGCDVARYRGDLYLRQSVPELAGAQPPGTVLVGACTWEPPAPEAVRAWLAASEVPVVLVQQARTFGGAGFWRQATGLRGVRLAASTARMDIPRGQLPPGALVAPFVPQGAVLARASVVICSGTTTSALGALTQGVLAVVVPEGAEQHEVAETLVGAGSAIRLRAAGLTVEGLQAAVDHLLRDPQPRARAQAMRVAFARFDGAERAAHAIVALHRGDRHAEAPEST